MDTKHDTGPAARRLPLILVFSALLAALLLLAGCQGFGPAAAGGMQLALVTAPPTGAATADGAAAGPTGAWTEAGQVTITPAAPDAETTPEAAATATDGTATSGGQPVQFSGAVENLPGGENWNGDWQVGGRLVHVAPSTVIDQRQNHVAPGTQVIVEGWPRADGSLDADWVLVMPPAGAEASPTPVPAEPSATPTPIPPAPTQPPPAAPPALAPTAAATAGPAREGDEEENQGAGKQPKDRQGQGDDEQNEAEPDNHNAGNSHNPAAPAARPVEFRDAVQSLPGSGLVGVWLIGGRMVNVSARTRVQLAGGTLRPGAIVQVMGWQQPDGSINAAYVMTKKNMNAKGSAGNAGRGDQPGQGRDNGKGNGNGKGRGSGGRGKADKVSQATHQDSP